MGERGECVAFCVLKSCVGELFEKLARGEGLAGEFVGGFLWVFIGKSPGRFFCAFIVGFPSGFFWAFIAGFPGEFTV
jgi:hypothetical protein